MPCATMVSTGLVSVLSPLHLSLTCFQLHVFAVKKFKGKVGVRETERRLLRQRAEEWSLVKEKANAVSPLFVSFISGACSLLGYFGHHWTRRCYQLGRPTPQMESPPSTDGLWERYARSGDGVKRFCMVGPSP